MGYFCPKYTIMLSLNYLKSILFVKKLPEIDGINTENCILEARAGLDGAIQLIQNKDLPVCIVLEHAERHSFSLRNMGGFQELTQSLWVMEMVGADEPPEDVMDRCLARCKRIYTILVNRYDKDDKQLRSWVESNEVSAYAREAGSYVGYEMFIAFRENIDLSYEPRI